ncbi:hypothetical protein DdX_10639 [Ditylenchus destructor]|uniref:Uncharacterized protein n=1 Tax=Ditylenchus destructor TaxID=166010 RepID=A0AAD4N0S3_9BILA|nr:hypothetical protein DdX_10639 [Ditylenchus destructor]
MQHSTIFVFVALASTLEGALGGKVFINDSEVGRVDPDKSETQILYDLRSKFHVIQYLAIANSDLKMQNGRLTSVRITGREIQVYFEKSRSVTNTETPDQIVFEPLSAPLVVKDKRDNGNDRKLTPAIVRDFLRTFGIWRQVHVFAEKPTSSNKLGDQGLSSASLSSLWITSKNLD